MILVELIIAKTVEIVNKKSAPLFMLKGGTDFLKFHII